MASVAWPKYKWTYITLRKDWQYLFASTIYRFIYFVTFNIGISKWAHLVGIWDILDYLKCNSFWSFIHLLLTHYVWILIVLFFTGKATCFCEMALIKSLQQQSSWKPPGTILQGSRGKLTNVYLRSGYLSTSKYWGSLIKVGTSLYYCVYRMRNYMWKFVTDTSFLYQKECFETLKFQFTLD